MKKYINGVYGTVTADEIVAMEATQAAYESSPEFKLSQIQSLKEQLYATDYKAIKYAEGWITEEEYAPIRAERQALRDEINRLEESL